jgi:hypothetical protein
METEIGLITRRRMLQVGSLGLAGVTLARLLRADAERRTVGMHARADACILVFLDGGPSHLDMWDMKPEAPPEIRGEFQSIETSLPGVRFSEHLPRLARHMHHSALIRSAHHTVNNAHAAAVYTALTGHDRGDATVAIGTGPNDFPAIGSITGMVRPRRIRSSRLCHCPTSPRKVGVARLSPVFSVAPWARPMIRCSF